MDMFRSEEMQLMQVKQCFWLCPQPCPPQRPPQPDRLCVQLMMPAESAHDTVAALGQVGLLQFKDLNTDKSAFQRSYASQVQSMAAKCTVPPEFHLNHNSTLRSLFAGQKV